MTEVAPPTRPRVGFRQHVTPAVVPGDATYLVSERGVVAVPGEQLAAVAPLLDGSRDFAALVRDAKGTVPAAELGALLGRLAQDELVSMARTTAAPDPEAGFWEAAGLDASAGRAAVDAARVRLVAVGSAAGAAAVAHEALAGAGLEVVEAGASPRATTLTVVLCGSYLDPELDGIDRAQRAANSPWLLAKPSGITSWTGPFFVPGDEGGCWHCLTHRLDQRRGPERHVEAALGMTRPLLPPAVAHPAGLRLGLQLVALEAAKWIAGHRDPGQADVRTLDTLTLQGQRHAFTRRPQCPGCGDPGIVAARTRRPVVLESRPKAAYAGGSHRAVGPAELWERHRHLVGGLTGVVSDIRRDPHGPDFLNCFRSGHNPARPGRGLAELRSGLRAHSAGKGTTELEARVGAMCEALERYSGCFHGDELRVRSSFRALGDAAVHPDLCQLYHPRQFADRHRWNAEQPPFQHVCDPFDESAEIDWTPVWSLTEQRQRMLPTALLYFSVPQEKGRMFTRADSNGNAAGSSPEDAVVQGFFELVERDAVALWWYNRTRQPAVDLDAFGDPWTDELRERYRGLHREVWALDLTSDLGVPVVAALSRRTDKPHEDVMFGFGAHFDPRIALRRALTEMNQLLPAVATAGPEGDYACDDASLLDWCRTKTVADQPYLLPGPDLPAMTPASCSPPVHDDLLEDVRYIEALVRSRGMELLVLDQTRPDVGLPVVKVVVPGLRHFWARFGEGRLYDVPVELGRLTSPTPYEELNPVPIFV